MSFQNLTQTPAWLDLVAHAKEMQKSTLVDLFKRDSARGTRFSLSTENIYLDYSKNHLTHDTLHKLIALAEQQALAQNITALSNNKYSSNHLTLRDPASDAYQHTLHSLEKLLHHVEQITRTDQITDIVHLGVGGSYLGPVMVNFAGQQWHKPQDSQSAFQLHYAYAMDGRDLSRLLVKLKPQNTLFIVASKSFTSIDTLVNAELALSWLQSRLNKDKTWLIARHFIGISAYPEKMHAWGIAEKHQLTMNTQTVGRYSLWSVMGLPIALYLGLDKFKQLLAGAYAMDQHFKEADFASNIPVIMGLLAVWNHSFLDYFNHIHLPYHSSLEYLPYYLQQLSMESLGKSCTRNHLSTDYITGAVTFGAVGFAAQHSFFQLLHQGTGRFACDFIGVTKPDSSLHGSLTNQQLARQHKLALANCFTQSRILMSGSHADQQNGVANQSGVQYLPGNKPSTTLLLDKLTPFTLGSLLALYEHQTFVESVIYHIDPFSQDGVELGKRVAEYLYNNHSLANNLDSSSTALLRKCGFDDG